jgi:hypothetical protein
VLLFIALVGCHGGGGHTDQADTDGASAIPWPISPDDASEAVVAGLPWATTVVLMLEFVRHDLPSCPTVLDSGGNLTVDGGCGGFLGWTFEGHATYDHSARIWSLRDWKMTEDGHWEVQLTGTAQSEEAGGYFNVDTNATETVVTHSEETVDKSFQLLDLQETGHGLPPATPDTWSGSANIADKGSFQVVGDAPGGVVGWCASSGPGTMTVTGGTTLVVALAGGNCPECASWTIDGSPGQTCHH